MRRFRLPRGTKPLDILLVCFLGISSGLYIWVPFFKELEQKGTITRKDWAKSIKLLDIESKSNPENNPKTKE